jgi:hypothetical protein
MDRRSLASPDSYHRAGRNCRSDLVIGTGWVDRGKASPSPHRSAPSMVILIFPYGINTLNFQTVDKFRIRADMKGQFLNFPLKVYKEALSLHLTYLDNLLWFVAI